MCPGNPQVANELKRPRNFSWVNDKTQKKLHTGTNARTTYGTSARAVTQLKYALICSKDASCAAAVE